MARFTVGCGLSVSVAVAVSPVVPGGGETVTVFVMLPVASDLMFTVNRNVAVPPTAKLIVSLSGPEPLAGPLEPAPLYVAVHDAVLTCGGNASTTFPFAKKLGPEFVAMIV
jgi:hypothetical protein